ncbi:MAG: alkylation response protein AidB-like acyl-CoA dehydrogenase [Rhodothermales bacterium]|jgi:alkylation response protein AidB-like acyl-CoA dehydrogenase
MNTAPSHPAYSEFLETYKGKLKQLFHERSDVDRLALKRGLPPFIMREIRGCDPLTVWIPEEYGGRGGKTPECLAMLAASSYESLGLALTFGINGALFLQPLARYGQEATKRRVYDRVVKDKAMGGLMITEPDYGSDALAMKTSHVPEGDGHRIKGVKHWGGLTGWADFWLVTARPKGADGQLGRDIDFFVCDVNGPDQNIVVEEFFENLGLYMIPYGRNRLDIRVPANQRLLPESTGITMMLDILHRSRIEFPGMAMGFLHRIMDEGIRHCKERMVGGSSLFGYDQVQERLAQMQAYFTSASAMCAYTGANVSLADNMSRHSILANSIKTVATDMMQDASQSLLQLFGGKGYRLDSYAGRATVDSRPFQIFEGSNDILYQQIAEAVLKTMRRLKEPNLGQFLKGFESSKRVAGLVHSLVDFQVDTSLPQRKLVELGKALGRIFTMELTIDLGERGFRKDLIDNSLAVLHAEVDRIMNGFRSPGGVMVQVDYQDGPSWLDLVYPSAT